MKGDTTMETYNSKYKMAGILLFVLLSFVLVSCAQQQPNPPKEVSILWSEIDQGVGLDVGDILEIVLPTNPSTGYAWEAGFYNQTVLKPYGEAVFSNTGAYLGAEESQIMHFEAIDEGETDLVLVYRRSFEEEGADLETFQVHVVVK
jgi:predicted secreted protein